MVLACGSESLLFFLFIFLFICHDFFETSSDVLIPIYHFSFAKQSTSFIIHVSRSGRNGTLAPKRHFEIRAFKGTGPSLIVPCCYRNSIDHSIEAYKPSQDSCQV